MGIIEVVEDIEGVMNLFLYILYIQVTHCKIDLTGVDEILEMNQSILYILTIPGVVDMISNLHRHTIMTNLVHPCILFIPITIYKHHKEEVEEKAVIGGVRVNTMTIILIHHLLFNHLFPQTTHYCIIRYKGIGIEEAQQIIWMMEIAVDIGEVGVIIHFNQPILTINMMIIDQFNRILLHYNGEVEDRVIDQGRVTSLHYPMMKTMTMMITWLVEASPSRHVHELDHYDVVRLTLVQVPMVMILVEADEAAGQQAVKEIHGVLVNQSLIPLQLTVLDGEMIEEGMMTMMHHYSQPPHPTHTAVRLVDHQVWVVVCLNCPKSRLYLNHLNILDRHHNVHSAYHINVLIERVHMNMIVMIV